MTVPLSHSPVELNDAESATGKMIAEVSIPSSNDPASQEKLGGTSCALCVYTFTIAHIKVLSTRFSRGSLESRWSNNQTSYQQSSIRGRSSTAKRITGHELMDRLHQIESDNARYWIAATKGR